jgi:membrane protease YdiL (CAAX protease family)
MTSNFPPPTTVPVGWHLDPEGSGSARYFDGHRWLETPAGAVPGQHTAAMPPARVPVRVGITAVVVLLLSLLLSGIGLLIGIELGLNDAVSLGIAMFLGYAPAVLWASISARKWGTGDLLSDLGLRARWVDLGWGPVIWFGAITTQILLGALILAVDLPTVSNTEGISELGDQRAQMLVLAFGAVVLAPVVEELIFRGLLLRSLLGVMGAPWAILIQAVLFGLVHLNPEAGIANLGLVIILTGVGVVFGVAAHRLGRLAPTIIAHAIFNAVVLALVTSGVLDDLV